MIEISLENSLDSHQIRGALAKALRRADELILEGNEYWLDAANEKLVGFEIIEDDGEYRTLLKIFYHPKEHFQSFDICSVLARELNSKVTTFIYSENYGPKGEDSLVFEPDGSVTFGISRQDEEGFSVCMTQDALAFEWIRNDSPLS